MVSSSIASQYSGALPTSEKNRKIVGQTKPLYSKEDILNILSSSSVVAWSRGCIEDMQKWEFDQDDIDILTATAVECGKYLGSEWCQPKPEGPWAACDAYRLIRTEWNQHAFKEIDCVYYIKVAIGKTGRIILLASCHPDGC
ncbi:hypothetical protein [Shewanella baltica]|uniref:hypothetical protein n=1 Tax=Shewanella baltica TaxID=62322 RepID=UPI003D7938DB